jgi:hypothetical protein
MNKLLFVPLLAALVAAPAWAGTSTRAASELAPAPKAEGFRELVEVQSSRSPVAVIARDALYGAVDAASADRYMAVADSTARERDARSQNLRSGSVGYGMKF